MIGKFIKTFLLLIAGMTYVIPAISQYKYDYNWVTGFYYVEGLKRQILDFGSDTLQVKDQLLPFAFSETNSCISDESGNLLLYFNGCDIANGRHEILENGSGFNAGIPGDFECPKNYGYPGPYQSALILPQPESENIYYVFYMRYDNSPTSIEVSLLHAKVDMTYDQGTGIVLYKDKQVSSDSVVSMGSITAVRHANNEDWWLILFGKGQTNEYKRILFTKDTLMSLPNDTIGVLNETPGGQASFSPDGTKYMRYTPKGLMVMDFDRNEGLLSNFRFLPLVPQGVYFGGTFSPNGRFIYLSDYTKIYQVDTWEEELSLDLVAEWDGYEDEGWRVLFSMMQTGPDCRIYIASQNCLNFVHIIMNPDEKGTACNVVQRALELKSSNCSFPHFPNFRLGTSEPYCDPDKVVVTGTDIPAHHQTKFDVSPNPVADILLVTLGEYIPQHGMIHIHDAIGRIVLYQRLYYGHNHIDMASLQPGLYFWTAEDGGVMIKQGKVVKI